MCTVPCDYFVFVRQQIFKFQIKSPSCVAGQPVGDVLHSGVETLSACAALRDTAQPWHTVMGLWVFVQLWQHFRRRAPRQCRCPGYSRDNCGPPPSATISLKSHLVRANIMSHVKIRLHGGAESPAVLVTFEKVYCLRDDKWEVAARVVKV